MRAVDALQEKATPHGAKASLCEDASRCTRRLDETARVY